MSRFPVSFIHMTGSTTYLPSESVPVVRLDPLTHQRQLVHLHWGIVPAWAEDPSTGGQLIHARSETVAEKPTFRESFRQRRCLLVVDSFDLGKGHDKRGPSYAIQRTDRRPFGVGAIWDRWQSGGNEPIESCAVITTAANEIVRPINDRMPVIIAEDDYERWLDPEFFDVEELERMMQPCPLGNLEIVPF